MMQDLVIRSQGQNSSFTSKGDKFAIIGGPVRLENDSGRQEARV